MRIWIVAQFMPVPEEDSSNRFLHLYRFLRERGHQVTVFTSSFSHGSKTSRQTSCRDFVLVSEPGYHLNVSLRRYLSHRRLAANLRNTFHELGRPAPDCLYVGFPSIDVARVALTHARQNSICSVLDVQDLWPEGLRVAFRRLPPGLFDLCTSWLRRQADEIFRMADLVWAVSRTYADRVSRATDAPVHVAYLGTDLEAIQKLRERTRKFRQFTAVYFGSFSHSYDLRTLIRAASILRETGKHVKVLAVGRGPHFAGIEQLNKKLGQPIEVLPYMPWKALMAMAAKAHVGINCIVPQSATSLPNKVFDYAALGLPIVNSVMGELSDLLSEYRAGLTYAAGCPASLASALNSYASSHELVVSHGANALQLASVLADRNRSHVRILESIERVAAHNSST